MSSLTQHMEEPQSLESERDAFFRILTHDDRNSYYIISTDAGGTWSDSAFKKEALGKGSFQPLANYYVTHNGFTGRQRRTERVRQLNALFFDIDCHGAAPDETLRLIDLIQNRITDAMLEGRLPVPTMVVDSGRGVHLYYVLERSVPYRLNGSGSANEKGLALFKLVQERIAGILGEVLEGLDGASVDRAVFDHTRVARIPGTLNVKAGRRARLIGAFEAYYHLADLADYKPSGHAGKADVPHKSKGATIMNFHPLMMSRLGKVAELQEHRGFQCEGRRELMCFVFYNTAVQLYNREDACERLSWFNGRFSSPLKGSEIDGIVRAVDGVVNVRGEKGHYILKADTLINLLGLTEQEMDELSFFASKRLIERMEAKLKTKEKKEARNKRIIELHKAGGMTQAEIAREVGCSPRTVSSVLSEAKFTRHHAKSAASQERCRSSKPATAALKNSESSARVAGAFVPVAWRSKESSAGIQGLLSCFPHFANFWLPCLGSEIHMSLGGVFNGLCRAVASTEIEAESLSSRPRQPLALPSLIFNWFDLGHRFLGFAP